MKNLLLSMVISLIPMTVIAEQNFFNLENLIELKENKHEKEIKKVKETDFNKYNKSVSKITMQKQTSFELKKAKEIDIYIRGNYNVLANKYVVKQPEHWIKVLVKEEQLWY
jgi:hypothetical protein